MELLLIPIPLINFGGMDSCPSNKLLHSLIKKICSELFKLAKECHSLSKKGQKLVKDSTTDITECWDLVKTNYEKYKVMKNQISLLKKSKQVCWSASNNIHKLGINCWNKATNTLQYLDIMNTSTDLENTLNSLQDFRNKIYANQKDFQKQYDVCCNIRERLDNMKVELMYLCNIFSSPNDCSLSSSQKILSY